MNASPRKFSQQRWALVVVAIALAASEGFAADLDPSFGAGGKVVTDVSGRYDEIRAVMIQPDGRIVAAGVTGALPARDFALVRYNPDGTVDPTFGAGGSVITDFSGGDDDAWALAMQRSDGKIVVVGVADGDFALARYNVDGTSDLQFGINGRITLNFGGNDRAFAVAIQPDGKIVAAGVARGVDFAIARVDSAGRPDATFGVEGRIITDFSGNPSAAFALAIRSDEKIIAVGSTGMFPLARFAVAQYNGDGSPDDSFGVHGRTAVDFGRDARAHAVALQADGKIFVGGFMNQGSSGDAVFARLTTAGSLDPAFGDIGRLQTDFGGRNFGSALALQADGRIVVAGFEDFPPYYDFAIARYEADGRVDATFNSDGTVRTEFGGNSWINAVALQPDGKIVAAGYARGASTADFALVRYQGSR